MCISGRVDVEMKTRARYLLSPLGVPPGPWPHLFEQEPARLMDGGCDGVKSDGTTTDPLLAL